MGSHIRWCSPSQLLAVLAVLICLCTAKAGESNHRYKNSEEVVLWVNKVGPYNNPQVRGSTGLTALLQLQLPVLVHTVLAGQLQHAIKTEPAALT